MSSPTVRRKRRTWMMYGLFNYSTLYSVHYRKKDAVLEGSKTLLGGQNALKECMKDGSIDIRRVVINDWGFGTK